MQKIFSKGAAYAVLAFPCQLEAYDTDKWQGWVHVPGESIGDRGPRDIQLPSPLGLGRDCTG